MSYEFYSAFKGTRPIRTCEKTRKFAWDSLHGVYGNQTKDTPALSADNIAGFENLSNYGKYDAMIRLIAEESPIRICDDELLCGSASLGLAVSHVIPVTFHDGIVLGSVSHLTCGFDRVLREGLESYKNRITNRMQRAAPSESEFLKSLENTIKSIEIWHSRYIEELGKRRNNAGSDSERFYYTELIDHLKNVPFNKPVCFREAIQSLWFLFAFTRLCGNWSGIGRIDLMLGDYLKKDLAEGRITLDDARELIAHFWIKGCEWIRLDSRGTGDAQHYQNVILAGVDEEGSEITNDVTYLVLEVVEEFPIPDYPIAVRIHENTDDKLLHKIAEVIRHGSGVAAVYNERLIISSLVEFGYSIEEARRFANDGCWEIQIPGKTLFSYQAIDIYSLYESKVLGMDSDSMVHYGSFEELYDKFNTVLAEFMENWHLSADGFGKNNHPASVISLFEDDCIENACDYFNGGTRYISLSPHLGGVPDLVNSMYAIKKLVFDENKLSFTDFINILKNNWEGYEDLRQYVSRNYVFYGNDNDEADVIAVRVMDDFMNETRKIKCRNHVLRPPGISTFGRQIDWKDTRKPHAHGFKAGTILASNLSPTPGTDKTGATAVIRSHCKVNLENLTCGTALDIKLEPNSVKGEEGLEALESLISGFVALGGFFLQIDVLDNAVLLEAQKHPELYQNLAVRISGWSARFVTLNDDWQKMIIERSSQSNV